MTTRALPTTLHDPAARPVEAQLDSVPMPQQMAHERIAELAYGLYLARGGEDGHDLDDWLEAEGRFVNESMGP